MPTLTWDYHNRETQADVPIAWDEGDTGREAGQQAVIEWRWRANTVDAWSAPTIHVVDMPASDDMPAYADGWVQVNAYCIRDGIVSWQSVLHEFYFVGGVLYTPGNRITDAEDRRITDAGDVRVTE